MSGFMGSPDEVCPMRRTELLQEVRKMRFEEACGGWQERRLTQEEAARMCSSGRERAEPFNSLP